MLRSVSRIVLPSLRPIETSSRTSGTTVVDPSLSEMTSLIISRQERGAKSGWGRPRKRAAEFACYAMPQSCQMASMQPPSPTSTPCPMVKAPQYAHYLGHEDVSPPQPSRPALHPAGCAVAWLQQER